MHIDSADKAQLQNLQTELNAEYQKLQQAKLKLDLTRGKPGEEQLSLSNALDGILEGDYTDADGVDVRNYGGLTGIREARELGASILGCEAGNVMAGGNSSLSLMYQVMEYALNFGLQGQAWSSRAEVKFLCPVPGYDRHFTVCEHLGIHMISVPMTDAGPDMDQVEALVAADSNIVGMWCVPRFSNPCGRVYSPEVVERIARLGQIAGPGFLTMWDNAYAVHSLSDDARELTDINPLLREHGTENTVVQFGSTSKITFAGAGMAFLGSGEDNISAFSKHLGFSSIGPDKVNQLRHVRFLRNRAGVEEHMRKHRAILSPRFSRVLQLLEEELADSGMGTWTHPLGGYFVLFNSIPGLAGAIVEMASDIGVKLTPAGSTWPYGEDPHDSDIRLAPSFPTINDVDAAMRAFITCVKLASVRQKLAAD
jgi:DNA-binding transcriptional MocR family regulator